MVADHQGLADIEIIIAQGKNWLKPQGWIALEHGYDQGHAVRNIFAEYGFSQIKTIQDYGQNERVTLASL
ncbi:Release factor glutamine methyltransferase [compost metagenome]